MGATLGTTSTPWMVAYFGFRVKIASFAMPMLGVGGLLWLVGKGKAWSRRCWLPASRWASWRSSASWG
jgi:Na+/phosphate symporter